MKKRIFAIVTALMLVFVMLTGCGDTSKDNYHDDRGDYLDDIEELSGVFAEDDLDDVKDAFKDLDVKTSEGQAVEKALKKYIDAGEDLGDSALYDLDEDDLKKAENVMKDMYDALDDFIDAAEDAGVDKDDLKGMEEAIESLSNSLDDFDDIRDGENSAATESVPMPSSARDDYLDDIEELNILFDVEGDVDDVKEAFMDLDVKTSEGQAVEKALEKYIDAGEDLSEISLDDMDKDDLKRVENVTKDLYDALDDFMDAAEDVGVGEDDLKDMEETIESLSDFLDDIDYIKDRENSAAAESVPMPSSARDDYLDDIEGISSLNDADISSDPEEMADDLNDVLKELKLKTPEGKAIKKDLQDMVDILDKMVKNMDDLDEDEAEKMYNDLMEIYDKLEDHVNDFIEAAEDAGVDDNDIADLDIDF